MGVEQSMPNPYGNTMYNPMMMQQQMYNPMMQQPSGQGGYMAPFTNAYQGGTGFTGGLQNIGANIVGGLGNNLIGGFVNGMTNAIFQQPQQMQEMQALPDFTNKDMGTMYGNIGLNNAVSQSSSGLGQNSSAYSNTTDPTALMDQYKAAQQSVTDYNTYAQEQNAQNSGLGGFFRNVGKNLGF